jgi:hypothetical protein
MLRIPGRGVSQLPVVWWKKLDLGKSKSRFAGHETCKIFILFTPNREFKIN